MMSHSILKLAKLIGVRYITNTWSLVIITAINIIPNVTLATELKPPQDGWVTWQVAAIADAPDWCCYQWQDKQATKKVCNLDSRHSNYGGSHQADDIAVDSATQMQIYAYMQNGQPQKIRTLTPSCPVTTKTKIIDLGSIVADDSSDWLNQYIAPHSDISTHALAAVAVHAGDKAQNILVSTAKRDADTKNRMDAIFWMGQVRALNTEEEIKQIMFNDQNKKIREHAAFSLSQSVISDRADALIELANNDSSSGVRGQAWFWLTQTKAEESETSIFKALQTETNQEVQEQAIFALSQLPEQRAVKALMTVIENQKLSRQSRKNALFWMAQNESEQALVYLESVLAAD